MVVSWVIRGDFRLGSLDRCSDCLLDLFVHGGSYGLVSIWALFSPPFCASLAVRVLDLPLVEFLLLVFGYSITIWGLVVSEMNSCLPNTGLGLKARYFDF